MTKSNPLLSSLGSALGVTVYVAAIAWLMSNSEKVFGEPEGLVGPLAFLLLFVVSALITGLLVLGRPAQLYLDSQKREAITLLGYTVAWLAVITAIALIVLAA